MFKIIILFLLPGIVFGIGLLPDLGLGDLTCKNCAVENCAIPICDGDANPTTVSACDLGRLGQAVEAPVERGDCFPKWFNESLFLAGQRISSKYKGVNVLWEILGLVGFATVPQNSDVFFYTATNDCPMTSRKFFISTAKQMLIWAEADIGNDPQNPFVLTRSLHWVRQIHANAGKRVRRVYNQHGNLMLQERFGSAVVKDAIWDALKLDMEAAYTPQELALPSCYTEGFASYVPANQFNYGVTQWGFMALPTRKLFAPFMTDNDVVALNHWFAVTGYMMGIDDKFNSALKPNLAALRQTYDDIQRLYIIPGLYNLPHLTKYFMEFSMNRLAATEIPVLNYTIPALVPIEGVVMSLMSLVLNKPYANLWAVASPEGKAFVTALEYFRDFGAQSEPFQPALNAGVTAVLTATGARDFGACSALWTTNCQVASKMHYMYSGPDENPMGANGCSPPGQFTCPLSG